MRGMSHTPSLVLGTAGHIDHGKSSLVKALTGTDPDRLPEEKERGVTIELGFARLDLPSGRTMGVVDVPGHERFVRQMVAGATGIDVVMLCVAADDGVMPQTREHLAIIDLLGVGKGVVALTKSDLADPEWLEMVSADVSEILRGTSIAGAPVVAVSARTGEGLPALLDALDAVAAQTGERQGALPFRLPIDRVFTIQGAGTVVTGTVLSGRVARDDHVEVLPGRRRARVRSVQVHSERVDAAFAGQRVALNLAGLERAEVARGDVAAAPGTLAVADRVDVHLTYLAAETRPLKSGVAVHVHHGTREVVGRVLLMDGEELAPGGRGFAQLRLDEPIMPRYGDPFVIRSLSPMWTIGGGVVLDTSPPRRTTPAPHEREMLKALLAGDVPGAVVAWLVARGLPSTPAEAAEALGVPERDAAAGLQAAPLARLEAAGGVRFVEASALDALLGAIERELLASHCEDPASTGVAIAALRDRVDRRLTPEVFDALLELATAGGAAARDRGVVRHPAAAVSAIAAEGDAAAALLPLLESQGLAPGSVAELAAEAGVDAQVARRALARLAGEGAVVRVGPELHFAAEAVAAARDRLGSVLREHPDGATAAQLRDALGVSRKYAIPLLEWFDAQGVTRRQGDLRLPRP